MSRLAIVLACAVVGAWAGETPVDRAPRMSKLRGLLQKGRGKLWKVPSARELEKLVGAHEFRELETLEKAMKQRTRRSSEEEEETMEDCKATGLSSECCAFKFQARRGELKVPRHVIEHYCCGDGFVTPELEDCDPSAFKTGRFFQRNWGRKSFPPFKISGVENMECAEWLCKENYDDPAEQEANISTCTSFCYYEDFQGSDITVDAARAWTGAVCNESTCRKDCSLVEWC